MMWPTSTRQPNSGRGSRCLPAGLLLCLLTAWLPAQAPDEKKICLTFDDLPYMKPMGFWRPREVSNLILRTLEAEGIKAAGFVSEEKIDEDTSSFVVLDDWAQRGHILGNQTYSDVDLHQLSAEDFLAHVGDGQKYLRRVSNRYKFNFRYLRFPLLHEGDTPNKKKDVRRALYRGGYEIAVVTVPTSSHVFNRLYLEVEYEPEKVEVLKRLFLEHVGASLDHAEKQSQAVFGRNIPHILQLHGGIGPASFLADVVALLKTRGYQFVSLEQALADEAYQTEETYIGPLSLSFIDRVAATRLMPFEEGPGELSDVDLERKFKALVR